MNNKGPKKRTQTIKGTEYVFEDYPYWNKEKQQMRHKRVYIGKYDSDGKFIPNKFYKTKKKLDEMMEEGGSIQYQPSFRVYFGAAYLLDSIIELTGIKEDLMLSFPDQYLYMLSLAFYLVMEKDSPICRFSRWATNHSHPYGKDIPVQRISEMFNRINSNTDGRHKFFVAHKKRLTEKGHLAYDTTNISSFSELNKQVKFGLKEVEGPLPKLNLFMVFGQQSMMPVYYRHLPGNIANIMTVRNLLKDLDILQFKNIKLVFDRGFFSEENINDLYKNHYKFLLAATFNNGFVGKFTNKIYESIKDFKNYNEKQDIYIISSKEKWGYKEHDKKESTRRLYLHAYYNAQRAENKKTSFMKAVKRLEACVIEGNIPDNQKATWDKFFIIKETPVRGVKIDYKEEAIQEHIKKFGYFVLLSNEIKDPAEALHIYRNKDLIEKSFANIKNRLKMRRELESSDESLEGKIFIQFIAFQIVSYIHKCMKDHDLYRNYNMQSMLDELDVIEKFSYPDKKISYSEITEKQKHIYECFSIKPPGIL